MDKNEDILYIEKFKSGDERAFEHLYKKYKRPILNYLYGVLSNRARAEELAQETLVKVYLNIQSYRPTGKFSSWVYAIARNLAKNEFRRQSHRKSVSIETKITADGSLSLKDVLDDGSPDPGKILDNKDLREQINDTLSEMPADYREVLVLCLIQGLSYKEASKVLNCSCDAVAIRLHRARKSFIKLVKGKLRS
ncbi:RNA polymerase sigma factor [Candidatus Omnitrophota bacterium]